MKSTFRNNDLCGLTKLMAAAGLVALAVSPAFAASQSWTNAPVSPNWPNTNNWVARAVPGVVDNTVNNGVNTDIATFTNAIPGSLIGGTANPIIIDDAVSSTGKSRMLGGMVFDTANCGSYVFYSPSPYNPASTLTGPETGILNFCVASSANPQGGTTMNAPVTSKQIFLISVGIRLPSSTDGFYGFTNNATSPQATFFLADLFQNGSTTRGVTFVLDGSNTGTNTIASLRQSPVFTTGVTGLRKQGTGTWILSGPNNFRATAPINIIQGMLVVQDPGAFSLASAATITNGTLRIDNVSLTTATLNLKNGGTLLMNGAGTVNGVAVGNNPGTSVTLATTSPTDVLTVGTAPNNLTGGTGDTVTHIAGPGTVLLSQPANYIGRWSVDTGTNQVQDPLALGTGGNITINIGAVFDTTLLGASTYSLTTKAITANGTGMVVGSTASAIVADPAGIVNLGSRSINLTFTPTTTNGDTGHPALYLAQGAMQCGGNAVTINNASGKPLNVGTYQLIHQASGSISASGTFATYVTGSGLAPGLVGEVIASGADINLTVYPYVPLNLVWTGADPLLPGQWDRELSTNWLSGATPSIFNIYDVVTFNATGSGQPNVNLVGTVEPGSVVVNTAANNYNFTGSGQIAAGASLTKIGVGTLNIATANTYSGGTVISNGVLQSGIDNAVPSTGAGDVVVYSPGVLDLNGFADTINGLNGNGTVDITSGGTSTLTIGANDNNATFSGIIQNTSGTLNVWKSGLGTETLTTSNGFSGTLSIDTGTVVATNLFAAGFGPLNLTNGTLDLGTNLIVAGIGGTGGSILNNQNVNASRLYVQGSSTVNSLISGKVALTVLGGTVRLNAANTYSNGTTLAIGAGLAFGSGAANAGAAAIVASNNATLNQANTGSSSSAPNTPVNTVDGAQVTFTSANTANAWAGQFTGSAIATNIYSGGNMTISGSNSFSGFLGAAIMTGGGVRWFNAASGGDKTTFDFVNGGGCYARDNVDVIRLGALFGNGAITGPSVSQPATYYIGAKPIDSVYSGSISGSNNIVKTGTNMLTFNGVVITTNTDSATYTNYLYGPSMITYLNNTTISNGVLAMVVPNDLTTSPNVTLSGSNAVLDATQMGYVSNQLSVDDGITPTNSFLVTNGIYTVVPGQTLGGFGTVKGLVVNNGTIAPGLATSGGTLILSNNLIVNGGATLAFGLSDDSTGTVKPNDQLTVISNINISGSITIAINALNGGIRSGTYPLIRYSGSLSNETGLVPNGPIPNFTLGGNYQALPGTMVLSNTPGAVVLTVTNSGARNLTWTGDGVGNLWDVANSITWLAGANPTNFYQVDSVRFTDSGAANPTVNLVGSLAPASLVVSNSNIYSFGSNGTIISLTSLLKQGSGTLILSNGANSYTGGTLISNGVLNVGSDSGGNQNDQALSTGVVTVNGTTAELRFGGNAGAVVNHFVSNSITMLNGGIVKAQDGVQHLTNSTVTLGAGGGVLQTVFLTKDLVLDSPLVGAGNLTVSVPAGYTGGRVVLNHGTNTLSGNITIATNGILALVNAAGITNSPVIDVQQGGFLDATLRTGNTWTLQTGQTLYGNGMVRALNAFAAAGSVVSPGEPGALGTLYITNAASTNLLSSMTLAGSTIMEINRGSTPNSDRLVAGTNTFGGTLTVNNLGVAPVLNDSFTLFTSVTNKGAFATVNLPALSTGLGWSNSLAINGMLTVISVINTNAFTLTNSLSGNVLKLSWPADHTGYRLLVQTNTLGTGLNPSPAAWFTVPGSASVNSTNITINPNNGTVFYRMVYP